MVGKFFGQLFPNRDKTEAIEKFDRPTSKVGNVYTIFVPQDTDWQPERAYQLVFQLLELCDHLIFQIVADEHQIAWKIVDLWKVDEEVMTRAITAAYPLAQVVATPWQNLDVHTPFFRLIRWFRYRNAIIASPMLYVTDIKDPDPLESFTQSLTDLQPGDRISLTLVVAGKENKLKSEAREVIYENGRPVYEHNLYRYFIDKLDQPLYQCLLFFQVDAPTEDRAYDLAAIETQLKNFDRPGMGGLINFKEYTYKDVATGERDAQTDAYGIYWQFLSSPNLSKTLKDLELAIPFKGRVEWAKPRIVLEPHEIAALWHLPHEKFTAPTIHWVKKEAEMPPSLAKQTKGIVLGTGTYLRKPKRVLIQPQDRAGHMLVLGRVGMGKSTFLHTLIQQDIHSGHGVCVVDLHGDLVRDMLRYSIPDERKQDVVVIDFADTVHPPGFNLLQAAKDEERSLTTASRVAEVIELMSGDMRDVPRTRETLENVLATLWLDEKATLFDVPKVFNDEAYREQLLQRGSSRALRHFWDGYKLTPSKSRYDLRQPVEHRIRSLYNTPALETIMGHPQSIDLQRLIGEDKIILVSLDVSDKIIPKRAKELLGAIILSAFEFGAIQRSSDKPFYVYIDEAHLFVTSSLSDLFVEVRKRGIVLTLATQFLKQLKGKTLEAIEGTVGSIVAFSVGDDDARDLPMMRPQFDPPDLVKLDRFEAAVWMKQGGVTLPAFSMKTLAPNFVIDTVIANEREKELRALSQRKYTSMSSDDISKWLDERYSAGDDDSDILDSNPDNDPEGDSDKEETDDDSDILDSNLDNDPEGDSDN